METVAYMSIDGRLMSAANRNATNRTSVANRYGIPLVKKSEAEAALAAQPAPVDGDRYKTMYYNLVEAFDKYAQPWMREDGDGGFAGTLARMAEAAQPAPVVGGVSELLEQLRSELAGDKGWDYTEYEKGRLAEKERVISQLALLAARPGGDAPIGWLPSTKPLEVCGYATLWKDRPIGYGDLKMVPVYTHPAQAEKQ